jgi:hypothetical protein
MSIPENNSSEKEAFSADTLKKMLRGTRNFKIYPFPGYREHKIAIKMLTQKETDDVEFSTVAKLDRKLLVKSDSEKKDNMYPRQLPKSQLIELNEKNRQLIYRFLIRVPTEEEQETGNFKKFFNSPEQVGEILNVDQVNILIDYYFQFQEEFSPVKTLKDYDDFENLIKNIKKNSTASLYLSTFELNGLVDFMVANPLILLKVNGISHTLLNKLETNLKKPNSKKQEKKLKEMLNQEENY